MPHYSVATAKNGLPGLIEKALNGEEVVITRHGKSVVELRPTSTPSQTDVQAMHEWMSARRDSFPAIEMTSVELLNQLYEEE